MASNNKKHAKIPGCAYVTSDERQFIVNKVLSDCNQLLREIKSNALLFEQNLNHFMYICNQFDFFKADNLQEFNVDKHLKNLAISNCNLVRAFIDKLTDSLNEE